jgi:hypothetical protein
MAFIAFVVVLSLLSLFLEAISPTFFIGGLIYKSGAVYGGVLSLLLWFYSFCYGFVAFLKLFRLSCA